MSSQVVMVGVQLTLLAVVLLLVTNRVSEWLGEWWERRRE